MASIINVPLKTILPYHMDSSGEPIPEGYAVCDGSTLGSGAQDINPGSSYTVPDLRNRFLLGADPTLSTAFAGTTTESAAGAPGVKGTGGSSQVTLTTNNIPAHNHTLSRQEKYLPNDGPGMSQYLINFRDTQTHTETTANTGSGTAHENRPRYYGVVFIMRVKIQ